MLGVCLWLTPGSWVASGPVSSRGASPAVRLEVRDRPLARPHSTAVPLVPSILALASSVCRLQPWYSAQPATNVLRYGAIRSRRLGQPGFRGLTLSGGPGERAAAARIEFLGP